MTVTKEEEQQAAFERSIDDVCSCLGPEHSLVALQSVSSVSTFLMNLCCKRLFLKSY